MLNEHLRIPINQLIYFNSFLEEAASLKNLTHLLNNKKEEKDFTLTEIVNNSKEFCENRQINFIKQLDAPVFIDGLIEPIQGFVQEFSSKNNISESYKFHLLKKNNIHLFLMFHNIEIGAIQNNIEIIFTFEKPIIFQAKLDKQKNNGVKKIFIEEAHNQGCLFCLFNSRDPYFFDENREPAKINLKIVYNEYTNFIKTWTKALWIEQLQKKINSLKNIEKWWIKNEKTSQQENPCLIKNPLIFYQYKKTSKSHQEQREKYKKGFDKHIKTDNLLCKCKKRSDKAILELQQAEKKNSNWRKNGFFVSLSIFIIFYFLINCLEEKILKEYKNLTIFLSITNIGFIGFFCVCWIFKTYS